MLRPRLVPRAHQVARARALRRAGGRMEMVILNPVGAKPPKAWMAFVLELVRMLLAGAAGFFGGTLPA